MKAKSITINAILNIFRTILSLIVPLITYPYVSRVIGAENIGKVNYVNSIVQYFILISALGISTYAIREGTQKRDDKQAISNFVSECFTINFIMAIVSCILMTLIVYSMDIFAEYKLLFLIQGFLVIFDLIGIEWINTVFEDYLYITIRTIIVYSVSIVATFLFIRTSSDYYKYALITVGTTGLVSILNWLHCRKKVKIRFRISKETPGHIKPILVFFANKLAVSLYVSSDTTMLGLMTSDFRVGIYSAAVKIYTIIKNLIAAIYTVCIPRLAIKFGEKDFEGYKELFSNIISVITILIFPATIGLFMLSDKIIIILFGLEYFDSIICLKILSIGIIFSIYGGIVSAVFNVTQKFEKISLQATIVAAITNIVLNFILIPKYQESGAAYTTVIAELVTLIYCLVRNKKVKDFIDINLVTKNILHSVIGSIEIICIVYFCKVLIVTDLLCIVIAIVVSIITYLITLLLLKNNYINFGLQMVLKKIKG